MKKWQLLEFDGKPYYAFVPEDEEPIKEDVIPELTDGNVVTVDDDKRDDRDDENNEKLRVFSERANNKRGVGHNGDAVVKNDQTNERTTIKSKDTDDSAIDDTPSQQFGKLFKVKVEGNQLSLEQVNVQPVLQVKSAKSFRRRQKDSRVNEEKENENNDEDDNDDLTGFEEYIETNHDDDSDEDDDDEIVVVSNDAAVNEKIATRTKTLKCKLCTERFDNEVTFKKHVALVHKRKFCVQDNGAYNCAVCDFRTERKTEFVNHLLNKHETTKTTGKGKNIGNDKNATSNNSQDTSDTSSSSSNKFPCDTCGFVCRSKHSLQSHFIRKHTESYEYQCNTCEKKFKVKGDLTNHVRFQHKERPIDCDVCGKVCMNSGSLYVHQKWAHFKPKYECKLCHRRMVSQENLDLHMVQQHEKHERVMCQECGKTFTKKDSFKRHMSVHTGSKPYICVICNKPFARRSQLRQHLLIHTGKRPFVCDICGKAFTQKPGLICHRKTHPGDHPPLPKMPIGDLVKQFTDDYVAGNEEKKTSDAAAIKQAFDKLEAEGGDEDEDDEDEDEDEDEEEEVIQMEFEEVEQEEEVGYEEIITDDIVLVEDAKIKIE